MKYILLVVTSFFLCQNVSAQMPTSQSLIPVDLLHLPLDLSSDEYGALMDQWMTNQRKLGRNPYEIVGSLSLQKILVAGKRNLAWLKYINDNKNPVLPPYSFTSAATQPAYPIETPVMYNETIIVGKYQNFLLTFPDSMKKVIVDGQSFTKTPPIALNDYLTFGRNLDYIYQSATRWILLKGSLPSLAQKKYSDVRGYYYFSNKKDIATLLKNVPQQPKGIQTEIRNAFISMCLNNYIEPKACDAKMQLMISQQAGNLKPLYDQLSSQSQRVYRSFFDIPFYASDSRSDVTWVRSSPEVLEVPFKIPSTTLIENFVRDNIEKEWKLPNWSLHLAFNSTSRIHVEFSEGTFPHVNGLGSDTIYMDANTQLTEFGVQWMIRHEFGHILGFPDCYLEFYDTEQKAIINYQIDTTDLMCSRRGHIKARHYLELKRVYN